MVQHLRRFRDKPGRHQGAGIQAPSATWRPGTRPVFLFGDLHNGFTAGPARPVRSSVSSGASPWTAAYAARPGAQLRAARRLSPAQQQALDDLRTLGASGLTADFTDADIKSTFRALARKFHPSTHPGLSDLERAPPRPRLRQCVRRLPHADDRRPLTATSTDNDFYYFPEKHIGIRIEETVLSSPAMDARS